MFNFNPISDLTSHRHETNIIRDGEGFKDTPRNMPAYLWTPLPLSGLFMRSAVWSKDQPQSFNVVGIWSTRQAVDTWKKHNAINGFPEKIPKGIAHTHLFKRAREGLHFLTRLLVVSCLGSEGDIKAWHQTTFVQNTVCGLVPTHRDFFTSYIPVCARFTNDCIKQNTSPGPSQPHQRL